jgi:predicted RNase H-like nuclease (RuvC/YqgF family)
MDNVGLTAVLAAILGAPIGAVVQWIATRNKNAGEAHAAIAGGAKDVVEASSMMLDQMQETIDNMKEDFEKRIRFMQKEINDLRIKLDEQRKENVKLSSSLEVARQTVESLQNRLEQD